MINNVLKDLEKVDSNRYLAFFSNRGFHALLIYRISNSLYKKNVPLLPLILTRIIQIIYSIDIDYRAKISGGVSIVHGVGLVVGQGCIIKEGVKMYHGVTLGISEGKRIGFPTIETDVIIGAGAKILGPVLIGKSSKVGANAVVIEDMPSYSIVVGIPGRNINSEK